MNGKRLMLTKSCWTLLAISTLVTTQRMEAQHYEFDDPVRLKAGGEFIDTGKHNAHSGPAFADVNDDGLMDLLVGNYRGMIEYFENTGTEKAPVFSSGKMLQAEGKDIQIHNW